VSKGTVAVAAIASGLPYYYTPLVCVPDVIGGLGVWRHNTKKNQREGRQKRGDRRRDQENLQAMNFDDGCRYLEIFGHGKFPEPAI